MQWSLRQFSKQREAEGGTSNKGIVSLLGVSDALIVQNINFLREFSNFFSYLSSSSLFLQSCSSKSSTLLSLPLPSPTYFVILFPPSPPPQWGAADAEIKVPSGENTELKRSPFQAWSRSVYSHTCYAYCQGVLPCLFLPFQSIHLHFFQNLSQFFPVLACRIK